MDDKTKSTDPVNAKLFKVQKTKKQKEEQKKAADERKKRRVVQSPTWGDEDFLPRKKAR